MPQSWSSHSTTPLNIALVQGLATTGQPAQAIALADQALYVLLWVIFPRCAKGLRSVDVTPFPDPLRRLPALLLVGVPRRGV
jgi:hypothetical protein